MMRLLTLPALMRQPYVSPEAMRRLRTVRLRRVVAHAKRWTDYYGERLRDIDPDALERPEDVGCLPITTADGIRREDPERLVSRKLDPRRRVAKSTSGTSGKPFRFALSSDEIVQRQLKFVRVFLQHGWRPWWRGVHVWRRTPGNASWFQRLVNLRKITVPIDLPLEQQVSRILELKPDFIYGMYYSLDLICNWMTDHGLTYHDVRFVTTGGGKLSRTLSIKLETVFGHPGIDRYGTEECGLIGTQCPHCGLKILDDAGFIVEVLDDHGRAAAPGTPGRVVITALEQFSTPILRYEIGDLITLPERAPDCPVQFTHFVSVDGRESDYLVLDDGSRVHSQHIVDVQTEVAGIRQVQFYQRRGGVIEIRYVPGPGESREQIERDIYRNLTLADRADFRPVCVESIPADDSGKVKEVVREA